ncbi:MAG: S9 family peptidase [Mesorhizobium sp.]|nr:MAG: S9 family peptidase [Mesorhizobium sp.]
MLSVMVAEALDTASARRLTGGPVRPVSPALFWAADGRHVVVFRDSAGDENYQAFSIDVDTGAEVALTPDGGTRTLFNRTSRRIPSDILFSVNHRNRQSFDLVRANVTTGRRMTVFENPGFSRLHADAGLAVRFGERVRQDGSIEVLKRQGNGEWVPFLEIPAEDSLATHIDGLSADGEVVFLLDSRGRDRTALVAIDARTVVSTVLATDSEADIAEVVYDPDTGWPLAAAALAARRRWHPIDETFAADLARQLEDAAGLDLVIVGVSAGRRRMVIRLEASDAPAQLRVFDRGRRRTLQLFPERDDLEGMPLRPMLPVAIQSRDGLTLPAYVTLPAGRARRSPLVVVVHGGPYDRDAWGFSPLHQWLASRGYAVLSVNFRGSTGFGKAFTNAADREWGGRMQDDLDDGVAWAVKEGIADPDRVGLFGASYGGYAALMAAARSPDLYNCFIDICGPSDLLSFIARIPPYWHSWFAMILRRLADPATMEGRKWLQERSPLIHVEQMIRPMLIAQGLRDVRVSPAESRNVAHALLRRNVPVTLVTFPDEGHFLVGQRNRIALMAVVEQFLACHLGGSHELLGDDLQGSSLTVEIGGEWLRPLS